MNNMNTMSFNTPSIPISSNTNNYNMGGGSFFGSVGDDPFAEI